MNTRSIKKGDIILVETKAERGYAIVTGIEDQGRTRLVKYRPLAGEWQKGRLTRDPATARQIKGHWAKRNGSA